MVLNDRFDVEQDRRERPQRPIPSGRITPQAALLAGMCLLVGGIFFACLAGWLAGSGRPVVIGLLLALAVVGYDAGLKQSWFGPLVMGLCRALNVLLGASLAPQWPAALWLVAVAIGIYTVGLTQFARFEAETSPRRALLVGGVIVLFGMGLVAMLPVVSTIGVPREFWLLLWVGLIGWAAFACWRATEGPSPQNVQAAVVRLIRLFVVIDSAICLAVSGPGTALVILSLLLPMYLASRWAPMT